MGGRPDCPWQGWPAVRNNRVWPGQPTARGRTQQPGLARLVLRPGAGEDAGCTATAIVICLLSCNGEDAGYTAMAIVIGFKRRLMQADASGTIPVILFKKLIKRPT